MKIALLACIIPVCIFGADLRSDYRKMLESFGEYATLPLKEEKKEYFREFWDRSAWEAYGQKNPEALTEALKLSGFDVSIPGLIELFRFRPLPYSERHPDRNLDNYKKGMLTLIATPTGVMLSTDPARSVLVLHSHENWKHLFYQKSKQVAQILLIRKGTLTESEIEKLKLEPIDADNPVNSPENPKNHTDD